jgi:hypothetical protein
VRAETAGDPLDGPFVFSFTWGWGERDCRRSACPARSCRCLGEAFKWPHFMHTYSADHQYHLAYAKESETDARVSSHWVSGTSPLCEKHFWQMSAKRVCGDSVSSPSTASTTRSYQCRWGGGIEGTEGGDYVSFSVHGARYSEVKGTCTYAIARGCMPVLDVEVSARASHRAWAAGGSFRPGKQRQVSFVGSLLGPTDLAHQTHGKRLGW